MAATTLSLLIFLQYIEIVSGGCPNLCTGHGMCGTNNLCACEFPYTAAPDCSQMVCEEGFAWASKASAENTAHALMECSNQGVCNRANGKCVCQPGYEGIACDRLKCGSDNCNGHGACMTIGFLYDFYTAYSTVGGYDTNWDAGQTATCVCDMGYTGNDCSMSTFIYRFLILNTMLIPSFPPSRNVSQG